MLELLESKSMSAPLFTPKPDRPPRVEDPADSPPTLSAAKERISALKAELRQARGTASPPTSRSTSPRSTPAIPTPTSGPQSRVEQLKAEARATPDGRGMIFNEPRQAPKMSQKQAPAVGPGLPGVHFTPNPVTEPAPQVRIPESACSPYLINLIIREMPLIDLLSALANHENTALAMSMCYNEAQLRRSLSPQDPT